ncbi:YfbU family protein [Enterobacter hormaechei]|uniref:YfbU family protein n=1 Tax=Enterobacter hormaechei TaxID=158836 RepID=UPI0028759465|nr:YfbU family protein [Enterobacter hormaechei]MDR9939512.1 YfbU family protein [Enterobacter hormaechei subsp. xiangfangensis]
MDIRNKIDTILLCDIAKHLGIETEIDTELVKYAITSGNSWILDAKYSFFNAEEASKQDREFVIDILNMYRGLSAAIRKLPEDTQQSLTERFELRMIDKNIQIPGFDGNNEAQYFSIVEAFLKFDRYVEQKEPIENTHNETVDDYSKMLAEYKKFDAPNRLFNLNAEEISSVLRLAPHGI